MPEEKPAARVPTLHTVSRSLVHQEEWFRTKQICWAQFPGVSPIDTEASLRNTYGGLCQSSSLATIWCTALVPLAWSSQLLPNSRCFIQRGSTNSPRKVAGASSRARVSQQRRGPRLMSPQKVTVTAPRPNKRKSDVCWGPRSGPRRADRTWKGAPSPQQPPSHPGRRKSGACRGPRKTGSCWGPRRRCHRLGDDFVGWSPGRHARDRPTPYRKTARTLLTPPRSPLPLWPNRRRSRSPPPETPTSRNITPDILWMSRAEYHILLFYQVDAPLKHIFLKLGRLGALPCRKAVA